MLCENVFVSFRKIDKDKYLADKHLLFTFEISKLKIKLYSLWKLKKY